MNRWIRFLRGETIHNNRDQLIWAVKIFSVVFLFGLVLASLAFWVLKTGATHQGGGTSPVLGVLLTPSQSTQTPTSRPGAPIKGLTDEPSYRWWRWPDAPQPDSWWAMAQDPQKLEAQLALMHELGVKLFRVELVWAFVAPTRPGGQTYASALARNPNWIGYHWQAWDAIVHLASNAGLQLVPQVVYSPDWASGITTTSDSGPNNPPLSAQFYGDFVFAAVTRYKGQIHYWEMWNEPDLSAHTWNGTAQQYVDLILKPGYQEVKRADPTAKVLIGGLTGSSFLSEVYAAGGGASFDIANFHAYSSAVSDSSAALEQQREVLKANGAGQKPIWLTEFGLVTQPDGAPGDPGTIRTPNDEAEQAQLIRDVFSTLNVQAIFFYQLHDTAVSGPGGAILKVEYYGLVSRDYSHRKLGFAAYKDAIGGVLPEFTI